MIKDSACGAGVAYNCSIAGQQKQTSRWVLFYVMFLSGIKFNVEQSLDVQEASALGYKSDIIQIYSNSWGPIDDGRQVEGPGKAVQQTFENGVFLVSMASLLLSLVVYFFG